MKTSASSSLFPAMNGFQLHKPVNVASVPHRSPFRYPGGKTWFIPAFRRWIRSLDYKPAILVEPFAGGGSISLASLFENLAPSVVMVELDEDVAAVWQSVVAGNAKWLARRVQEFDLTRESVISLLAKKPRSMRERAFQTIVKNRTFHGGILADGSGLLKYGENGKGIASRWYPKTIAKRIECLAAVTHRLDFRNADGLKVMEEFSNNPNAAFYIDPPYTAGGKKAGYRLYRHSTIDHDHLFALCASIQGDFLLTYDNAPEVKALAGKHGFQTRVIQMNNTHHATLGELVIGQDLTWLD